MFNMHMLQNQKQLLKTYSIINVFISFPTKMS